MIENEKMLAGKVDDLNGSRGFLLPCKRLFHGDAFISTNDNGDGYVKRLRRTMNVTVSSLEVRPKQWFVKIEHDGVIQDFVRAAAKLS